MLTSGGCSWSIGFSAGFACDPAGERVFEIHVALGHHLLHRLADQEGEELLGIGRMLGRFQHRCARHVQQRAQVAAREMVNLAAGLVRALLDTGAVVVIAVDHADRDRATLDRGDNALVVVEHGGIRLQPLQPGERCLLPLQSDRRGDERQEIGVGRRDGNPTLPFRLGEVVQRCRQVGVLDLGRVEGQHVLTYEYADPGSVRSTEL